MNKKRIRKSINQKHNSTKHCKKLLKNKLRIKNVVIVPK